MLMPNGIIAIKEICLLNYKHSIFTCWLRDTGEIFEPQAQ